MGYFSRKALELEEYKQKRMEIADSSREERLQQRLEELKGSLERLMELCLDDEWNYNFHRCFFEDYVMHYQDDVSLFGNEDGLYERYSVQGLLRSIREIEEMLNEISEEKNNSIRTIISTFLTGALPDGQLALSDAFDMTVLSVA